MPWLRIDDQAVFAPKVMALGNEAFGALVRIAGYAAAHTTNGWIPTEVVHVIAKPATLKKLLTVKANGRSVPLHRPDDECSCLEDVEWPLEGGYWVHDYLDRNPSKKEHDVHKAKKRELGDRELRVQVAERDGNACRYCGVVVPFADNKSALKLTLDHIDPRKAWGLENLAQACGVCNSKKKDCTPKAARMELLPPPVAGTVPESGWPKGTDPASIDRAWTGDPIDGRIDDHTADPIGDRSAIEPRSDRRSITDPTVDPDQAHPSVHTSPVPGESTGDTTGDATGGRLPPGTGGGGLGPPSPGGSPPVDLAPDTPRRHSRKQVGPATTPRGPLSRNPYFPSHTSNPPAPPKEVSPP